MDIPRKFTERWEMLNEMYDKQALSYTYHNKTSLKQGAYIHQPTAWPVPHACAQPYHPGSTWQPWTAVWPLLGLISVA